MGWVVAKCASHATAALFNGVDLEPDRPERLNRGMPGPKGLLMTMPMDKDGAPLSHRRRAESACRSLIHPPGFKEPGQPPECHGTRAKAHRLPLVLKAEHA